MPKKIIFNKTGSPEVLEYVDYTLDEKIPDSCVRIKQTSKNINRSSTIEKYSKIKSEAAAAADKKEPAKKAKPQTQDSKKPEPTKSPDKKMEKKK